MSKFALVDAETVELRVPPAVAEWRLEQGLPPIRPPRGAHNLDAARARQIIPVGWPYTPMPPLPWLSEGLEYDKWGVTRVVTGAGFRRHAARHSAAVTA